METSSEVYALSELLIFLQKNAAYFVFHKKDAKQQNNTETRTP